MPPRVRRSELAISGCFGGHGAVGGGGPPAHAGHPARPPRTNNLALVVVDTIILRLSLIPILARSVAGGSGLKTAAGAWFQHHRRARSGSRSRPPCCLLDLAIYLQNVMFPRPPCRGCGAAPDAATPISIRDATHTALAVSPGGRSLHLDGHKALGGRSRRSGPPPPCRKVLLFEVNPERDARSSQPRQHPTFRAPSDRVAAPLRGHPDMHSACHQSIESAARPNSQLRAFQPSVVGPASGHLHRPARQGT